MSSDIAACPVRLKVSGHILLYHALDDRFAIEIAA